MSIDADNIPTDEAIRDAILRDEIVSGECLDNAAWKVTVIRGPYFAGALITASKGDKSRAGAWPAHDARRGVFHYLQEVRQ